MAWNCFTLIKADLPDFTEYGLTSPYSAMFCLCARKCEIAGIAIRH